MFQENAMHTGVTILQVVVVILQPLHRAPFQKKYLLLTGREVSLGLHLAPAWRVLRRWHVSLHVGQDMLLTGASCLQTS